jgi:hypothetical protein
MGKLPIRRRPRFGIIRRICRRKHNLLKANPSLFGIFRRFRIHRRQQNPSKANPSLFGIFRRIRIHRRQQNPSKANPSLFGIFRRIRIHRRQQNPSKANPSLFGIFRRIRIRRRKQNPSKANPSLFGIIRRIQQNPSTAKRHYPERTKLSWSLQPIWFSLLMAESSSLTMSLERFQETTSAKPPQQHPSKANLSLFGIIRRIQQNSSTAKRHPPERTKLSWLLQPIQFSLLMAESSSLTMSLERFQETTLAKPPIRRMQQHPSKANRSATVGNHLSNTTKSVEGESATVGNNPSNATKSVEGDSVTVEDKPSNTTKPDDGKKASSNNDASSAPEDGASDGCSGAERTNKGTRAILGEVDRERGENARLRRQTMPKCQNTYGRNIC